MSDVQTDYYAKTTRSMLASVKEVGAMPFILFEYYLTWQTASEGIRPSLQRVADDLGISKTAVCNHKKVLIEKQWIRESDGEIFIVKTFRKSESRSENLNTHSENLNDDSEKLNEPFRKSESLYKEENKQRELTTENKQGGREYARPPLRELSVDEIFEPEKSRLPTEKELSPTKAICIYREIYPFADLHGERLEEFARRLPEIEESVWRQTLIDWRLSGYKSSNIAGMISRYQKDLESKENGKPKQNNFGNKRTDADVFRESADFYADWEAREANAHAN